MSVYKCGICYGWHENPSECAGVTPNPLPANTLWWDRPGKHPGSDALAGMAIELNERTGGQR